jgi:hypothetical protein
VDFPRPLPGRNLLLGGEGRADYFWPFWEDKKSQLTVSVALACWKNHINPSGMAVQNLLIEHKYTLANFSRIVNQSFRPLSIFSFQREMV